MILRQIFTYNIAACPPISSQQAENIYLVSLKLPHLYKIDKQRISDLLSHLKNIIITLLTN